MISEDLIVRLLTRNPFEPFEFRTISGQEWDVLSPDGVQIGGGILLVPVYPRTIVFSLDSIESLTVEGDWPED